ncbi:MAG: cold-shock protein [Planctomycetes bacterium RBG_16_64_12]|nr:MAG: cold-shock protein [Planctomycetes bacterium RBG_16_64_12]
MPEGTITKLFRDKGYGFVEGPRGYWFFHQSVLEGATIDALKIGQTVEYKEGCGPSGPRADSVRIV